VKDRPIIFSGPMVRALLAGRKTQTRRLLRWVPKGFELSHLYVEPLGVLQASFMGQADARGITCYSGPTGFEPMDRLYVREAFSYDSLDCDRDGTLPPWYWADGNPEDGDWSKPKPSIHMPRWASRLTLHVEDVRVERVQEITEEDAAAEGAEHRTALGKASVPNLTARCQFEVLWDSLHTKPGHRWEDNPHVVAVTFRVEHRNIDAPGSAP
jgi:hypothetical protein